MRCIKVGEYPLNNLSKNKCFAEFCTKIHSCDVDLFFLTINTNTTKILANDWI